MIVIKISRDGGMNFMKEGQQIRAKLVELYLSSAWLLNQLEKAGVSIQGSVLSNILSGTRKGPQADRVLAASKQVLDSYEQFESSLSK